MNENAVIPFTFQSRELRVVFIDEEPWWVAKDAAEMLGYANSSDAVKQHCKGVAKRYPLQTAGGVQELRVIREPDLYRLIVGSTLPAAVEFEGWVFEEVLPALRRDGAYLAAAPEEPGPSGECLVPVLEYVALLKESNELLRDKVRLMEGLLPEPKPERRPMRPLTPEDVQKIRALKRDGLSLAEIARRVNRSRATVHYLCRDMKKEG